MYKKEEEEHEEKQQLKTTLYTLDKKKNTKKTQLHVAYAETPEAARQSSKELISLCLKCPC